MRQIYDHTDLKLADAWVDNIALGCVDRDKPTEVRRLCRSISR